MLSSPLGRHPDEAVEGSLLAGAAFVRPGSCGVRRHRPRNSPVCVAAVNGRQQVDGLGRTACGAPWKPNDSRGACARRNKHMHRRAAKHTALAPQAKQAASRTWTRVGSFSSNSCSMLAIPSRRALRDAYGPPCSPPRSTGVNPRARLPSSGLAIMPVSPPWPTQPSVIQQRGGHGWQVTESQEHSEGQGLPPRLSLRASPPVARTLATGAERLFSSPFSVSEAWTGAAETSVRGDVIGLRARHARGCASRSYAGRCWVLLAVRERAGQRRGNGLRLLQKVGAQTCFSAHPRGAARQAYRLRDSRDKSCRQQLRQGKMPISRGRESRGVVDARER
ncbi:uncharacterized protein BDZ99DRAFT_471751 [Mytilinidion resinicola]|uniref:Uncharacterized protein n=1 Tax=Mytilinidion resinicola TaxID=574789 RepID=A0A6A6Z6U1_9PEZI|nr:uncharacterized protein BDZ99DRAFT_471751 [Mytilinidion resinicola]KAF2816528.1 hypothetical protein BDZ99DRAFT_471751 [Mytilinidion resinicola]